MKYAHQSTAGALGSITNDFEEGNLDEKASKSFKNTAAAIERSGGVTNTSVRYGATGTILAVSCGEVALLHKDKGDFTRHPSIVFCNKPAILTIVIEGVEVHIKLAVGDVAGLVACAFLHKLVRDPEDQTGGDFYCFTAWTEGSTVDKVVDELGQSATLQCK